MKFKLIFSSLFCISIFSCTESGGSVYASYQHSASNISLQTSSYYTMGAGGYGNVFLFYGGAGSYFDGMGGVSITL